MADINLDAAAAARGEGRGKGPTVTFKGEEFQLEAELPLGVIEGIGEMARAQKADDGGGMAAAAIDIVRGIFGEHYQRFSDLRPTSGDMEALIEAVMPAYGLGDDEGNSQASSS